MVGHFWQKRQRRRIEELGLSRCKGLIVSKNHIFVITACFSIADSLSALLETTGSGFCLLQ